MVCEACSRPSQPIFSIEFIIQLVDYIVVLYRQRYANDFHRQMFVYVVIVREKKNRHASKQKQMFLFRFQSN